MSLKQLRFSLIGCLAGAIVTGIGISGFTANPNSSWALNLTQFSAWLGFWATSDRFGCFPTNVNEVAGDFILVASAAIQWGVVGLLASIFAWVLRRFRQVDSHGQ